MAQRRGFTRGRTTRRLTDWGLGPGTSGATAFTTSSAAIIGAGITPSTLLTVVRTRGLFDAFLTSSTSPGDGFFGAVGIGLASESAFDVGIGSLPTPITELVWDGWLWHSFFSCHEGSPDPGADGAGQHRIVIDSKAMRKFGPETVIYVAVEVVELGTAAMSVFCDTRMLFKQS